MSNDNEQALQDLQEVINGGERDVMKGDRRITYRNLDELERIEKRLQRNQKRIRPHVAITTNVSRGL